MIIYMIVSHNFCWPKLYSSTQNAQLLSWWRRRGCPSPTPCPRPRAKGGAPRVPLGSHWGPTGVPLETSV